MKFIINYIYWTKNKFIKDHKNNKQIVNLKKKLTTPTIILYNNLIKKQTLKK